MLRGLLLVPVSLFTLVCLAQDTTTKAPAWTTWKGEGVALSHPTAWTVDVDRDKGMVVGFLSPLDSGDVFRENVNLLVQPTGDMDLPAYIALTEQQVRDVKGALIHSATQRNSTGEYHTFEYTATLNDLPLHFKQEVRLRGGRAYLVTFTSHRDAWDDTLYIAEAILGSFKWLEQ
ncbi:MAG: hypothetical protein JNL05_11320 [Flavobacteriales bacterium]|nr:hypothetical protein [Flavobacteriales bacterium]